MSFFKTHEVTANPEKLTILQLETITRLGLATTDFETWWNSSEMPVLLRCNECGEELWRDKVNNSNQPINTSDHLCLSKIADRRHRYEIDTVRAEYKLIHPNGKKPFRKRLTDAGYDVHAVTKYIIEPRSTTTIETGLILTVPPGYYYTIEGRSSLWKRGIFPNTGIIDATYTGQMLISMVNVSDQQYTFEEGDRIAQVILQRQYHIDFVEVEEFSPEYSLRGSNGFGSSGR